MLRVRYLEDLRDCFARCHCFKNVSEIPKQWIEWYMNGKCWAETRIDGFMIDVKLSSFLFASAIRSQLAFCRCGGNQMQSNLSLLSSSVSQRYEINHLSSCERAVKNFSQTREMCVICYLFSSVNWNNLFVYLNVKF